MLKTEVQNEIFRPHMKSFCLVSLK